MEQPPSAAMAAALPPPPVPSTRVNRDAWLACADPSARLLPAERALVYYFPRVHAEQCVPPPSPADAAFPARIRCTIERIDYFVDTTFDEPYAVIHLDATVKPEQGQQEQEQAAAPNLAGNEIASGRGGPRFQFPKEITSLFPALDDRSRQELPTTDVHGNRWNFTHTKGSCHRGRLLYFMDTKRAKPKDVVVFMPRPGPEGGILIGLRRRQLIEDGAADLAQTLVPLSQVQGAVFMAEDDPVAGPLPFSVTYYPRQTPDLFIVACKEVDEAEKIEWARGTEVRMGEPEDLKPRRTNPKTINGTVQEVRPLSHWRNLTVEWHQPVSSSSRTYRMPSSLLNMWQVRFRRHFTGLKFNS